MRIVSFATIGLLAVGVYAAADVMSNAPAFNTELRRDTVYGDWRTGYSADMYDEGAYLFQLGYGRLQADLLVSEDTETSDEFADFETAFRRAEEAVALLEESLMLDPANAHAWANLSWAAAMVGDNLQAHKALGTSWSLAPNNYTLAERRLNVVALLSGFGDLELELGLDEELDAELAQELAGISWTDSERGRISNDYAILYQRDPGGAKFMLEENPVLLDLIDLPGES